MPRNPILVEIEKNIRANCTESAKLEAQRQVEKARQAEKVAGILARAGIAAAFNADKASYPVFDLDLSQLVAARHALGKFEHYNTTVYQADGEHNKVQVELTCTEFPRVRLRYVRELPANGKCKIVTTTNTYTTTNLVCERK